MKSRWVALLLCLVLLSLQACAVADHTRTGHDKLTELILFGDDHYSTGKDVKIKERIEALKYASYLCLDQFNHQGDTELQKLKEFGVANLPGSISDIDFKDNSEHREYTHRGWDYNYVKDEAHWGIRKRILIETVNKVFDFGFTSGSHFGIDHYDKRCESFAAVVYYIHVLQDHLEKKEFKPLIMPIARANDSEAIIDELLKHFQVLFADQASSRVYLTMVSDIITVQEQAKTLVGSVGGLNTEEKLEEYYTCCENLRDVLKDGLHILLHRCDWFEKAFPAI